jgi:hypothetical protein
MIAIPKSVLCVRRRRIDYGATAGAGRVVPANQPIGGCANRGMTPVPDPSTGTVVGPAKAATTGRGRHVVSPVSISGKCHDQKAHRRIALLPAVAAVAALVPESAVVAATPEPPLRLVATGAVTVERQAGQAVRLDPGTHVVAFVRCGLPL